MKLVKVFPILCCLAPIILFAAPQQPDKLVYADFETSQEKRPVSKEGGAVTLFGYQERPTMPTRYKGSANDPNIPEFAIPSKDSPNRAIVFDYELQGTNDWAAAGVEINGHPWRDGKLDADDVSGYKYLTLQLYVTGVTSMKVEFASQGHGINTNGAPFTSFKVTPGFNTYRVPLKNLEQPDWAKPQINPKDLLKKLTSVKVIAACSKCVPTKGTVVIDNLVFQN